MLLILAEANSQYPTNVTPMPLMMETSTKDKTIGKFMIPDLTAEAPLTA
jgi:hypothetical protein